MNDYCTNKVIRKIFLVKIVLFVVGIIIVMAILSSQAKKDIGYGVVGHSSLMGYLTFSVLFIVGICLNNKHIKPLACSFIEYTRNDKKFYTLLRYAPLKEKSNMLIKQNITKQVFCFLTILLPFTVFFIFRYNISMRGSRGRS